jgi:hypothetical protein
MSAGEFIVLKDRQGAGHSEPLDAVLAKGPSLKARPSCRPFGERGLLCGVARERAIGLAGVHHDRRKGKAALEQPGEVFSKEAGMSPNV